MVRSAIPPARLRAERYLNVGLVIIDEVGFRPLDRSEANLFFRLVSARYQEGGHRPHFEQARARLAGDFCGDEILTSAILDHLLHHVVVIHIEGRSYRLRELDALLNPRDRPLHPRHRKEDPPRHDDSPVRKLGCSSTA